MAQTDMVEVEYIGDPDPLDPLTRFRIATGQVPADTADILRSSGGRRKKATQRVSVRQVDPEYFGTSAPYTFGPVNFVCAMPQSDYERIKESPSGHQFQLVGDPLNALALPRTKVTIISEREFNAEQFSQHRRELRAAGGL